MGKTRDVKHDTIYHVNWHNREYIVHYDENRPSSDHYIYMRDKTYASNAAFSENSGFLRYLSEPTKEVTIREATPEEDRWLRKCIEKGGYVDCPREEIINEYQIY